MIKNILVLILCLGSFLSSVAEDSRFKQGNDFYTDGKYEDAINVYQDILDSNVESAEVYFNLGNSYYKSGQLASAILNYERALLLKPHDKDIKYNRDLAASQITDKLDTVGEFFLISWFKKFRDSSKSDTWAIISVICFFIASVSAGVFFLSKKRVYKQLSFYLGLILLVISFTTFNFSAAQKSTLTHRTTAIVFSPSATVKSSPSNEGTELFILHEGTKVRVLESLGDWQRIEISDGSEGWLPTNAIVVI